MECKQLQYPCCENLIDSMKRQKDMILEEEPLRLGGDATGEEQRAITNSSRKNEVAGPKKKQHLAVDGSSGESKV